jgi:hypothetical protein
MSPHTPSAWWHGMLLSAPLSGTVPFYISTLRSGGRDSRWTSGYQVPSFSAIRWYALVRGLRARLSPDAPC